MHGLRSLALPSVVVPNSICFSPNGETMYFCDSLQRRIMKCEYHADEAKVANVRKFVRFAGDQGLPDGSVVDADGCLWNAEWGSAVVRRYTPRGAVDCTIAIPTKNPTCVVFGGSGLNELYVTSSRQESRGTRACPALWWRLQTDSGPDGYFHAKFKDSQFYP